jgi:hypothetical protein
MWGRIRRVEPRRQKYAERFVIFVELPMNPKDYMVSENDGQVLTIMLCGK